MADPSGRRPHILVVDDECSQAFVCLLEAWGYTALAARSVENALASIAKRCPGVILLDLGLPRIEQGFALVRAIRELPRGANIFILAVTGHGRDQDRRRAIAAGCDRFFLKPADLDQLHEALITLDSHREGNLRRHG
jgi:CheY-like chemotaxis protein